MCSSDLSNIVADDSGRGGRLISSMRFFGPDHGVLNTIGAGVYLAPDGGENWSRATVTSGSSALSDMMFLSDATGWASGDEGVWTTTDRRNERQKIAPQGEPCEARTYLLHSTLNATTARLNFSLLAVASPRLEALVQRTRMASSQSLTAWSKSAVGLRSRLGAVS